VPSWLPRTGRLRATVLALSVVVVAIVLLGMQPWSGNRHAPAASATPVRAPDPGMSAALAKLGLGAEQAPKSSSVWSRDRLRVLSRRVHGNTWRLALFDGRARLCWLLLVPRTTREGTCGRRSDVRKHQLLIYMGAQPDPRRPSTWLGFVVYGLVSTGVRSLAVTLSDCSALPVPLSSRPLYWAFLPQQKIGNKVAPIGFVLQLRSGRRIHGRLMPLRASAATAPRDGVHC
jgi:hypothetical protein